MKNAFIFPITCVLAFSEFVVIPSALASTGLSPHQTRLPVLEHPVTFPIAQLRTPVQQRTPSRASATGALRFTVRRGGPSRDRVSGISRGGSCSPNGTPVELTPLLPKTTPANASNMSIPVELTASARPAFFVYVPRNQAQAAQFTLTDEDQQPIYQTTFAVPTQPSVVGLQVPKEVTSLQVGSTYHWTLALQCDPVDRSGDVITEGWVQRTELNPTQTSLFDRTTSGDRPTFYARLGIWHDTLSSLVLLRLANPNDANLRANWTSLLTSVNLASSVAEAPIVNINLDTPNSASCGCSPTRP